MCLCRYPCAAIITYDQGSELLGHAFKNDLIENEYGIKYKCATMENPQEKLILERIYQVVSNLIGTFDLSNIYIDGD